MLRTERTPLSRSSDALVDLVRRRSRQFVEKTYVGDDSHAAFATERDALLHTDGINGVIELLDHGTHADGRPYLRTRFWSGGSLAALLAGGPVAPEDWFPLAIALSEILAQVHDAGIVHGDLKPGNVLLSGDGTRVCLNDFGSATDAGGSGQLDATPRATPGYAAPEVLAGSAPTTRSDVYSLAATLHTAGLGCPPSTDPTLEPDAGATAPGPPRQTALPDEALDAVFRALDREPSKRPASAQDLRDELTAIAESLGLRIELKLRPPEFEGTRKRRNRTLTAAGLVLVTGAASLVALSVGGAQDDPPVSVLGEVDEQPPLGLLPVEEPDAPVVNSSDSLASAIDAAGTEIHAFLGAPTTPPLRPDFLPEAPATASYRFYNGTAVEGSCDTWLSPELTLIGAAVQAWTDSNVILIGVEFATTQDAQTFFAGMSMEIGVPEFDCAPWSAGQHISPRTPRPAIRDVEVAVDNWDELNTWAIVSPDFEDLNEQVLLGLDGSKIYLIRHLLHEPTPDSTVLRIAAEALPAT